MMRDKSSNKGQSGNIGSTAFAAISKAFYNPGMPYDVDPDPALKPAGGLGCEVLKQGLGTDVAVGTTAR